MDTVCAPGHFTGRKCFDYDADLYGTQRVPSLPSPAVLTCKTDNNHTHQAGLDQQQLAAFVCNVCVDPIPIFPASQGPALRSLSLSDPHTTCLAGAPLPPLDLKPFISNHLLETGFFPVTRMVGKGLGQGETDRWCPGCISSLVVRARGEEGRPWLSLHRAMY